MDEIFGEVLVITRNNCKGLTLLLRVIQEVLLVPIACWNWNGVIGTVDVLDGLS
jgi:hypothetical protein